MPQAVKPIYPLPHPVWTKPLPASHLSGPLTQSAEATVPLETASAVSSATLVLTAPTQVPLQASTAVSSATLSLTAATVVVLSSADAISSATLAVSAPSTEPIWPLMGPLVAA